MWIGMLSSGLLLIIVAIFIHYSDSKEVEDVSLTVLIEETLKEHDEAGKELTASIEENIQDNAQELGDVTLDKVVDPIQTNNGNVKDDSTALTTGANDTAITTQSSKIDINTATSEQLQQLKGIGPSKAKAIIEDRELKGKYKNIADIKRVKGIGEKLYAGIQESIVAEP